MTEDKLPNGIAKKINKKSLQDFCTPHGDANPETYAFREGATFGYSLQSQDKEERIKELEALVEAAFKAGHHDGFMDLGYWDSWREFKKLNNIQ